ncbi:MAG: ABC transporter substrate-binding protein, partial [Paracoccus sp. (in: a-proteobacteria)]
MEVTRRRGVAVALIAVMATGWLSLAAMPALSQPVPPLPPVTIGVQENGTVNWELQTIRDYGLDHANGFRLEVLALAGSQATQVAMQGGQVDAIVSDWLWVAMQRGAGAPFTFWPYSTAVGGVVVPADSPAQSLADLEGQAIGIAGGPLDKSWLILRAWHRQDTGRDLADVTQQVYGAPPLIQNAAETGEVAGAINFWHFLAKM